MDLKKLSLIFRFGIRQIVVLALITVLLTALTVSGWLALQKEKENILREIDRRGSDISRFVAKSLAYSVVGYDYHAIQLLLNGIVSFKDIGYARVLSAKSTLMAQSGNLDALAEGDQKLVMFHEQIKNDGHVVGQLHIGLSNRATIERLNSQKYDLVKREVIIILLIDIDHFKKINDTFGHVEGNSVLVFFANILKRNIRQTDILCRIGGEEFVVFCRRSGKRDSIVAAENIRSTMDKQVFNLSGRSLRITTSIGVVTFPYGNLDNIDDIINCADVALYYCKESGRNKVAHFLDLSDSETQNIHALPSI